MKIESFAQEPSGEVSHNSLIKKHVVLANGQCANITQLARSVFPPGEKAESHCHKDMLEVFMIRSGVGVIVVDGVSNDVSKDLCVIVEPGEFHEVINNGHGPLVVDYFGLKVR